jgi:RNA polymerase sigma-70 factor (ECF subfamily)
VTAVAEIENDGQIIDAILGGDGAAFSTVVARYSGMLLRIALSFVKSQGIAEEVVQDTWIGVLNGLADFERRASLKTWIVRILINRAKTAAHKEGRTIPMSALEPEDGSRPSQPAVPAERFTNGGGWSSPPVAFREMHAEKRLLEREMIDHLQRELEKLPENQRLVVTLRDVDGLSAEEVCNALEISESNQRVLLHRGRSKLRTALEHAFREGNEP